MLICLVFLNNYLCIIFLLLGDFLRFFVFSVFHHLLFPLVGFSEKTKTKGRFFLLWFFQFLVPKKEDKQPGLAFSLYFFLRSQTELYACYIVILFYFVLSDYWSYILL